MRQIFTYMLVRNLPKINFDFIYKNKPIINKPICNPNLAINNYDLFYLLTI